MIHFYQQQKAREGRIFNNRQRETFKLNVEAGERQRATVLVTEEQTAETNRDQTQEGVGRGFAKEGHGDWRV